jgi:hypothetical protein
MKGSQPERVYALLVEANPVPDPENANETVARHRGSLKLVEPERPDAGMEDTVRIQPDKRKTMPRLMAPILAGLTALAFLAAVLVATRDPGDSVAASPEEDALARIEYSFAAIAEGRIDDLSEIFGAELTEGDRLMWQFNGILADAYPRELHSCGVVMTVGSIVDVECLVTDTDPVFVATETSDLIMPFQYVDGVIRRREFRLAEGSSTPFAAPAAYAEYLQLNHPDEFAEACSAASYTGDFVYNGYMVLAPHCAELMVAFSEDVASWVAAGQPDS